MEDQDTDFTAEKQQKRVVGRPFKKGHSGNPAGRPPGSISITTEIKRMLSEVGENQRRPLLDALVNKMLKKAIQDEDFQMMKEIWNHIDGVAKNGTESSSKFDEGEENKAEPAADSETIARVKRLVELTTELERRVAERKKSEIALENNNQIL